MTLNNNNAPGILATYDVYRKYGKICWKLNFEIFLYFLRQLSLFGWMDQWMARYIVRYNRYQKFMTTK